MGSTGTTAGVTGLGQVAITAADLERSIAFYRDVLGLTLLFTVPDQHMAFLDGGGVRVYLQAHESEHESRPILYWRVEDLDAAHEAVVAAGAAVESPPHLVHRGETGELWMAFVTDPDGNPVGLMHER
jgi:catechol 2,3-dioxygenase-like lactoylglutathione lyase family enzyme